MVSADGIPGAIVGDDKLTVLADNSDSALVALSPVICPLFLPIANLAPIAFTELDSTNLFAIIFSYGVFMID
jgi:hypothetical protein